MYIKFVKDYYTGRIQGAVVAIATNLVGWSLAKSEGVIDKKVKNELVRTAIARAFLDDPDTISGELINYLVRNKDRANTEFYDRVDMVYAEFVEMTKKAARSSSLPTLVPSVNERS